MNINQLYLVFRIVPSLLVLELKSTHRTQEINYTQDS